MISINCSALNRECYMKSAKHTHGVSTKTKLLNSY